MNTYEITQVSDQTRKWPADTGKFTSYRVTLRNADGREMQNVEVSRLSTAVPPKTGEKVEGTVEQGGNFGPKLQEPRKQGAGGFARVKSPEERRSIAMQASQKVAADLVRLSMEAGVLKPGDEADITNATMRAADKLFAQVQKAEAAQ